MPPFNPVGTPGRVPNLTNMARLNRLPWRVLAGVLLAVAGLALGWFWFRDSSFAAVERVTITGSGSSEQAQVRDALETTAAGMSTLHVDRDALEQVVAPFSSVAGLRVRADFPHDLRIEVIEHEPVATVETGGSTIPATGGGLLLDGVRARDLPTVATKAPTDGRHVRDERTLAALSVAAAAPAALRERAERLFYGPGGMTLELRDGPKLVFGSASDARTKWVAAARVLAEQSAAGATYLDLRVPKVVAAGGVGPIEPEQTPVPTVVPSDPQP
jgi:cell division protein FtsQ